VLLGHDEILEGEAGAEEEAGGMSEGATLAKNVSVRTSLECYPTSMVWVTNTRSWMNTHGVTPCKVATLTPSDRKAKAMPSSLKMVNW
jgi:hypothetical protein